MLQNMLSLPQAQETEVFSNDSAACKLESLAGCFL